jgi:glycosyltransferase involved in cell wall biosynthesis
MKNDSIVQELLLPGLEFAAPVEMYANVNEYVEPHLASRQLVVRAGGRVSFDTYFNGVSVGVWKRATTIDSLRFVAQGSGKFILRVGLHRLGHSHRWLSEHEVEFSPEGSVSVDMPWAAVEDGILYVALDAQTDGTLTGGRFETQSMPSQDVKLGIVVTHFNRKAFVVPAIRRIVEQLLTRPEYRGNIELIVVDNSRNLTAEDAVGATVIPNLNLGGAGGFTRGLLHLIDGKFFTHCLFMDDDASCEIESIRRSYVMQCFARSPKLAVSGALLREMEPFRLFEKGAIYRAGHLRPLNHWRDMRQTFDLLKAEEQETYSVYGAWWFFNFKISEVKSYPYPFFVRGDDVLFSILNGFKIETMNGISCWGEDFQLKENPATRYLGLRATLAIMLVTVDATPRATLSVMLGWFIASLFSYNYSSAEAITNAIRDVAKGPEFWLENMDMVAVRAELAPLCEMEKMRPVCMADYDLVHRSTEEGKWHRRLRLLTLNGFLLPGFLIRDATVFDVKSFRGAFRRVFRHRRVLYFYDAMGLGYVAEYDKRRFFGAVLRFVRTAYGFLRNLAQLKSDYRKALPGMTSEAFWRKIYEAELRGE